VVENSFRYTRRSSVEIPCLCAGTRAGMAYAHLLSTWFNVNGKTRGKKSTRLTAGSEKVPKSFP